MVWKMTPAQLVALNYAVQRRRETFGVEPENDLLLKGYIEDFLRMTVAMECATEVNKEFEERK